MSNYGPKFNPHLEAGCEGGPRGSKMVPIEMSTPHPHYRPILHRYGNNTQRGRQTERVIRIGHICSSVVGLKENQPLSLPGLVECRASQAGEAQLVSPLVLCLQLFSSLSDSTPSHRLRTASTIQIQRLLPTGDKTVPCVQINTRCSHRITNHEQVFESQQNNDESHNQPTNQHVFFFKKNIFMPHQINDLCTKKIFN